MSIADPFGLGFGALVVLGAVVELALAAGVEIGIALRAAIAPPDAAAGGILDPLAAFPAIEDHKNRGK